MHKTAEPPERRPLTQPVGVAAYVVGVVLLTLVLLFVVFSVFLPGRG